MDLMRPTTWPARPLVMGIVNVTPDSFSDGGHHRRWDKAVEHALQLVREGADVLDIGGESTRPGSAPVEAGDELERVLPVIRVLAGETDTPISIDTRKPAVAAAALEAGAVLVNDVNGLREDGMIETIARAGAGACIMHMRGTPRTMQQQPHYDDVVVDVQDFLRDRADRALAGGIDGERVWVDPGIGFGKALEHNLELLAALDRFARLGYPVLVGASRKRFIDRIRTAPVDERLGGSLAAVADATRLPRAVVRVHDVFATRQFLEVRVRIAKARAGQLAPALRSDSPFDETVSETDDPNGREDRRG